MKSFLLTAATAVLVVAAVWLLKVSETSDDPSVGRVPGAAGAPGVGDAATPHAPGQETMRDRLLRSTAREAGVEPVRGVWGVVMERGYAKGVATVVALADGTTSLHLSTGGSVVGGREYPPARLAARKLCERAADSLEATVAAHEFPPPAEKRVRFYVLTTDGVRAAEGDLMAHLRDGGRDALGPLVAAGDAVVDALKEATSKGVLR